MCNFARSVPPVSYSLIRTRIPAEKCNPQWRNPNHFANCSNFEQSLLKMVTRRKRWSTSAASGSAAGWKSGGPSLGRSPGAHKERRPVNQDQIEIFRGNRVDTIFRAGLRALLFFCRFERTRTRSTRSGASIYGNGIVQISAPLDRAFFAANLQLEGIRASEPRRGGVCEISTLPERDRAMLRRSDQIQSFEDRVATGMKITGAGLCRGCPD
jgi:hypothetical protein